MIPVVFIIMNGKGFNANGFNAFWKKGNVKNGDL